MRSFSICACVLTLAGCPGPSPSDDDTGPTDAPSADGGGVDAPLADGGGLDAGASDGGASDAAAACVPTPGPATGDAYCDLFELALRTWDDGAPRAELRGRLTPDDLPEGGCFAIDSVEVQVGGATVATLEGAPGMLAAGPAFAALTDRCEGDENRFGGFGFLVHGRRDGGTFTAACADAEGGSRWPPAVHVTCHHNVDRSPLDANAMVSRSAFGDFATLSIYVPHGSGAAITSVEPTVHVIPGFATAFGDPRMLAPFDSTGWAATVSETTTPMGAMSQISMTAETALPMEICPAPSLEPPGPGVPPSPVFLVAIEGASERGAYRTEAYANYCITTSTP